MQHQTTRDCSRGRTVPRRTIPTEPLPRLCEAVRSVRVQGSTITVLVCNVRSDGVALLRRITQRAADFQEWPCLSSAALFEQQKRTDCIGVLTFSTKSPSLMNGTVPFGLSSSAHESLRNAKPWCCSNSTPTSAQTHITY